MKHNFLAWRHLDPAPVDQKGSDPVLESIKQLGEKHTQGIIEVKGLITSATKAVKDELTEEIGGAKSTSQKALEKAEDIEKKMATMSLGTGTPGAQKAYEQEINEKLTAQKGSLGKGAKFSLELDRKAVGNIGTSANITGSYFVPPTVVPGMIMQPYNATHMRNVLSTGTTDSNVIRHIRDNGGEGGPTTVAEAATKPQMDRDLSIVDANVRKIATYLRVPEEMIEDIPYLTSFLTNVGTEEVLAVEDTQILYGDGTGQNLSGLALSGNFTAFAAGTSVVATPNNYDVLGAAVKQMRVAKRNPSVHLVSPVNYYDMISTKDSTGNYILQGGGNGIIPVTAGGVPVMQMNQIAAGDFITLDSRAAQLFFRSNINVRFYEQDQDNAIKNMVTIVIEERIALPIYFTSGIIKGTFSAAITDLTS